MRNKNEFTIWKAEINNTTKIEIKFNKEMQNNKKIQTFSSIKLWRRCINADKPATLVSCGL